VLNTFEHDLFRKPVSTFRDHALEHFAAATAALDQPGGGRAGYGRGDSNLQIFQALLLPLPDGERVGVRGTELDAENSDPLTRAQGL
jgi:hypothetical protein